MKRLMTLAALAMAATLSLSAKVTLPSVISDNMVLQQKTDAAIWGTATPGKTVTVKAGWTKVRYIAKANPETGEWSIRIPTPEAGGPYEVSISEDETIVLKNVLIGEVWFASGQSNMEMPMKGFAGQPAKGATDFILRANASRPIRICNIQKCSSITEQKESAGSWVENTPAAVAVTSATAYYFADMIQAALNVPVGIIVSSWGGSTIETWIKRSVIEKEFPELSVAHLDGTVEPRTKHQDPCLLYNGQVAPLIPFTFKGMLWYQGEANRHRPDQYIRLQEAYVRMMRKDFGVPDAPFYFVQIAPFLYGNAESWEEGYFNEAQQKTLALIPHSGMAVTCDVGELGTIHPCRKEEVGKRLAYLALAHDYGFGSFLGADAPTYKSVEFADGKALVRFNVDSMGLSPMGADIPGFEIAGEDKVFHPAKAVLYKDRKAVEVSSPEVAEPAAVRYCFRNWCVGGLYNNFGVPAAPFRTDDWNL